jgi:hypothetical protein
VVLIESDCLSFPPREPRGYLGLSDLSVSGHLYAQPHRAPTHMWGGDASWKGRGKGQGGPVRGKAMRQERTLFHAQLLYYIPRS